MRLSIAYPEYWIILQSITITQLLDPLCLDHTLSMVEWRNQSAILVVHLKFELNWMSPVMFPNGERMIAWVTGYERSQVVSVAFELTKLLVSLSLRTFKLEIHKTICFTYVWRVSQARMSWTLSTTWFMTSLSLVRACFLLVNSRTHQTT